MCLHIAVALELVAGQTWAALRLGPRLWDPLLWRHGPRYTCQGHGLSGQSVVPPRLSGKSSCFGPSRLGYPSLDLHSPSRRRGRPAGPGAGGLTSKPVTLRPASPARASCPTGLGPRKASQVGFGQLAGSCPTLGPPALFKLQNLCRRAGGLTSKPATQRPASPAPISLDCT